MHVPQTKWAPRFTPRWWPRGTTAHHCSGISADITLCLQLLLPLPHRSLSPTTGGSHSRQKRSWAIYRSGRTCPVSPRSEKCRTPLRGRSAVRHHLHKADANTRRPLDLVMLRGWPEVPQHRSARLKRGVARPRSGQESGTRRSSPRSHRGTARAAARPHAAPSSPQRPAAIPSAPLSDPPPRPPLPSSLTAPDRRDPAAARPLLARCSAPHPPALSCRLPSLRLHHSARSPLCRM